MSDLLVKALRVVEAARELLACEGHYREMDERMAILTAELAAFDAPSEDDEAAIAAAQLLAESDDQPVGEFPPLDVCSTGGVHLWADGACARCGLKDTGRG